MWAINNSLRLIYMTTYLNKMLFYINSDARDSGTHGDFTITLNIPSDKEVNRAVILDAAIKRSWYLIEAGRNTFILVENGIEVIITIPEGNYSFGSFKITLQNLLNQHSPNNWIYIVSTPNPSTGASTAKYTYSCNGGNPTFKFTDHLYEQMGFLKDSTNNFIDGSLISVNPVYFNKDVLHIHSDMVTDHQSNVLQTVSANGSDFSSIKYKCEDIDANSKVITNRSNTFRFIVMDENYRPVKLSLSIGFTLMLYKENDIDDEFYKMAIEYMRYSLLHGPRK